MLRNHGQNVHCTIQLHTVIVAPSGQKLELQQALIAVHYSVTRGAFFFFLTPNLKIP